MERRAYGLTVESWLKQLPRLVCLCAIGAALIASHSDLSAVVHAGLTAGSIGTAALVVGALVVGTPDGATDVARFGRSPGRFAVNSALYLASATLAGVLWFVAPLPTLVILLVVAAVHFGIADRDFLISPRVNRSRLVRTSQVIALGGIPVAFPLGLHADAVLDVLDPLAGGDGALIVEWCRWAIPVVVAVALVTAWHSRGGIAVDICVTAVLFAALGPLLAFAIYFAFWHPWRQSGEQLLDTAERRRISLPRAAIILLSISLPASAVAVAVVAVLAHVLDRSLIVMALVSVLCVTVPHSLITGRSARMSTP